MKKYIIATTNGELPTTPQNKNAVELTLNTCKRIYPDKNWASYEVNIEPGITKLSKKQVYITGNQEHLKTLQKSFHDRFKVAYEVFLNGAKDI